MDTLTYILSLHIATGKQDQIIQIIKSVSVTHEKMPAALVMQNE